MKPLIILAGGFGTRLRTAVSEVPKPLAPVNGKPFLMHLVENFVSQGADDLVFLLHFEAPKIKSMLKDMTLAGLLEGVRVRSLVEIKPLGTGGAILNAINKLEMKDSFLVANADSWLGTGLQSMNASLPPSLASITAQNCSRYGSLSVVEDKVVSFSEKQSSQEEGKINAGLYHLSPKDFLDTSFTDSNFAIEEELFPKLADSGSLNAITIETEFIDIGIPEDYFKFCEWMEGGKNFELSS